MGIFDMTGLTAPGTGMFGNPLAGQGLLTGGNNPWLALIGQALRGGLAGAAAARGTQGFGAGLGVGGVAGAQSSYEAQANQRRNQLADSEMAYRQSELARQQADDMQAQQRQKAIEQAAANPPAGVDPVQWRTYVMAEPGAAIGAGIKQTFDTPDAPKTRVQNIGNMSQDQQFDPKTKTWTDIGDRYPRWAPPQPPVQVTMPGIGVSYDESGRPVISMGAAGGKGKLDEGQRKALGLYTSAAGEIPSLMKTYDSLASLPDQAASYVPVIGNYMQSEDFQRAKNSISMIIQASLYSISGAQFNKDEYQRRVDAVTPRPGDKPGTIAEKKVRLQGYVDSIQYNLGGGVTPSPDRPNLGAIPAAPAAPAPSAKPDPFGIR